MAVSACHYGETEIGKYQAANDPAFPLDKLKPARRNEAFVTICNQIAEAIKPLACSPQETTPNTIGLQKTSNEGLTLEEVYLKEAEVKMVASLSAGIAHEVVESLQLVSTAIFGLRQQIQALEIDSGSQERLCEDLDLAQQGVGDINHIKDTMLNYVRLRQGGGCWIAPLDVNSEVLRLVSRYTSRLEMRNTTTKVSSSLAPDVGMIQADISQFRTMLRDLLRNADDALENQNSGEIQVLTKLSDEFVEVIVRDNGPGMQQSVIEKLERGERYTTKPLGIGLGLNLVYLACKVHGGSFHIDSQVGVGTSVVLRLPVSAETNETTTT